MPFSSSGNFTDFTPPPGTTPPAASTGPIDIARLPDVSMRYAYYPNSDQTLRVLYSSGLRTSFADIASTMSTGTVPQIARVAVDGQGTLESRVAVTKPVGRHSTAMECSRRLF